VFYIFHGEDEFGCAEELARLRGDLAGGDPAMAELNTSVLDGKGLTLGELRHVCDAIPFMADKRLVIVHGLLSQLASSRRSGEQAVSEEEQPAWKKAYLEDLVAYLPKLAPTTRLILVESRTLPASHPFLKLAEREETGYIKSFPRPKDRDLPGWIQRRARAKQGAIDHEATRMLAALVGDDLRLLDQEIEKLLIYANGRQVTAEDVRELVSRAREMSIFDLVDCVGRRQTDRALRLLHQLMEDGKEPLYVLAMLARQVRILIQVKELQSEGMTEREIVTHLKLHPFVVQKGCAQAQNFRMAQLEAAHQRLVETDWAIKTGQSEDVLALDVLITNLTRD
jgi:DNA polymerase-3 subunit delta